MFALKKEQLELFDDFKSQPNLNIVEDILPLNYKSAKFFERSLAFLIDILIIQLILSYIWPTISDIAIYYVLKFTKEENVILSFTTIFVRLLAISLFLWYFTINTYIFNTTLGKKLFSIYVVDKNNNKINLKLSLLRHSLYILSYVTIIGFFLPLFRKDKLALHDILSKTKTIKTLKALN